MSNLDNGLLKLLEMLDTETARHMLADLKTPEKCTPQLYNAIGKLLERHKFQISRLQPDANILGSLAEGLEDYNKATNGNGLTDEDLYGPH